MITKDDLDLIAALRDDRDRISVLRAELAAAETRRDDKIRALLDTELRREHIAEAAGFTNTVRLYQIRNAAGAAGG